MMAYEGEASASLPPLCLPSGLAHETLARLITNVLIRKAYFTTQPFTQWILLSALDILHGRNPTALDPATLQSLLPQNHKPKNTVSEAKQKVKGEGEVLTAKSFQIPKKSIRDATGPKESIWESTEPKNIIQEATQSREIALETSETNKSFENPKESLSETSPEALIPQSVATGDMESSIEHGGMKVECSDAKSKSSMAKGELVRNAPGMEIPCKSSNTSEIPLTSSNFEERVEYTCLFNSKSSLAKGELDKSALGMSKSSISEEIAEYKSPCNSKSSLGKEDVSVELNCPRAQMKNPNPEQKGTERGLGVGKGYLRTPESDVIKKFPVDMNKPAINHDSVDISMDELVDVIEEISNLKKHGDQTLNLEAGTHNFSANQKDTPSPRKQLGTPTTHKSSLNPTMLSQTAYVRRETCSIGVQVMPHYSELNPTVQTRPKTCSFGVHVTPEIIQKKQTSDFQMQVTPKIMKLTSTKWIQVKQQQKIHQRVQTDLNLCGKSFRDLESQTEPMTQVDRLLGTVCDSETQTFKLLKDGNSQTLIKIQKDVGVQTEVYEDLEKDDMIKKMKIESIKESWVKRDDLRGIREKNNGKEKEQIMKTEKLHERVERDYQIFNNKKRNFQTTHDLKSSKDNCINKERGMINDNYERDRKCSKNIQKRQKSPLFSELKDNKSGTMEEMKSKKIETFTADEKMESESCLRSKKIKKGSEKIEWKLVAISDLPVKRTASGEIKLPLSHTLSSNTYSSVYNTQSSPNTQDISNTFSATSSLFSPPTSSLFSPPTSSLFSPPTSVSTSLVHAHNDLGAETDESSKSNDNKALMFHGRPLLKSKLVLEAINVPLDRPNTKMVDDPRMMF